MHAMRQRPRPTSPPPAVALRVSSLRRIRRRGIAILFQRCPACLAGSVFRSTFRMLPACQVCGHRFEREPGFFRGAMVLAAGIAAATFVALVVAAHHWLVPALGLAFGLVVAAMLYLLLIPAIFRYPRVIRAYRGSGSADRGQLTGRSLS